MLGSQSLTAVVLLACLLAAEAKIVHLNGTEISGEEESDNVTLARHSAFVPEVINNHAGSLTKMEELTSNRRKDENVTSEGGEVANRDTTVLTNLRGVFDGLQPTITILSTILGLFIIFVLIESPLSPLPVPALPYPPIGPFPPTNRYPFGVPPVHHHHYGMRYAGPPNHVGYRIPRKMEIMNNTEDLEKLVADVVDRVAPDVFNAISGQNKEAMVHDIAIGIKTAVFRIRTIVDMGSQFMLNLFHTQAADLNTLAVKNKVS